MISIVAFFRDAGGRRGRFAALVALALVVTLGAAAVLTSPPRLLSLLDAVMGGGRGTRLADAGVSFGTHGQKLDVWQPSGGSRRRRPVVIFWYGGGWANGSREGYAFAGRAFARRGFVTIVPDYRKVPAVRFPGLSAGWGGGSAMGARPRRRLWG